MIAFVLTWFTLVQAFLKKKSRLVAVCVCLLVYDVAQVLYRYPLGTSETDLLWAKWAEHILFVLLIVSIFYASAKRSDAGGIPGMLPKILAGIAAAIRFMRQIFADYVLSEGYLAAIAPEEMANAVSRNANMSNDMFTLIHCALLFIMVYFAKKIYRDKTGEGKDPKAKSER